MPRATPPWRLIGVAAVCLLVLAVSLWVAGDWPPESGSVRAALAGAATAAGVVCFGLAVIHHRSTANVLSLWIAAGVAALAVLDHFGTGVIGVLTPSSMVPVGAPGAARLLVMLGLAGGLLLPDVDVRQRPWMVAIGSIVIAGVAFLALQVLPGRHVVGAVGVPGGGAVLAGTGAAAWFAASALAALRARRDPRLLVAWLSPACLAWALAGVLRALAGNGGNDTAALLLDLFALAFLILGLLAEVDAVHQQQSQRLRAASSLTRLSQDRQRIHDSLNALVSIAGATQLLHAQAERMDAEKRKVLVELIGVEIDRMRDLVAHLAEANALPDRRQDTVVAPSES